MADQELKGIVLRYSVAKVWKQAVTEWDVIGDPEEDATRSSVCVASHTGLRDLYRVRNRINGHELFPVGSECVKTFDSALMKKQWVARRDRLRFGRALRDGGDPMELFLGGGYLTKALVDHLVEGRVISISDGRLMDRVRARRTRIRDVPAGELLHFFEVLTGSVSEFCAGAEVRARVSDDLESLRQEMRSAAEIRKACQDLQHRGQLLDQRRGVHGWAVAAVEAFNKGERMSCLRIMFDGELFSAMLSEKAIPATKYNNGDPRNDVFFLSDMLELGCEGTPAQGRKLGVLMDTVVGPWLRAKVADRALLIEDLKWQLEKIELDNEFAALPEKRDPVEVFLAHYEASKQ